MKMDAKTQVEETRYYEFTSEEVLAALNIPGTFGIEELWVRNGQVKLTVARTGVNRTEPDERTQDGPIRVAALGEEFWN